MSLAEKIAPFLGRAFFAWFFVTQALDRVDNWQATVVLLTMKHVSFAAPLLALAVLAMIAGSLSLAIGFQTRFSALVLLACTFGWSIVLHDFWNLTDRIERAADYRTFAMGIALAGGLLVLVGHGGGALSIDRE